MSGQALPADRREELEALIAALSETSGNAITLIVKRGAAGASVFRAGQVAVDVGGFPVEILNTVGAGDAFASGLLYGFISGWDWVRSVRMANACGALVVTRHGCGTAMPTLQEATEFIEQRGGF